MNSVMLRALGPQHPTLTNTRCQKHCAGSVRLDTAFVLIDALSQVIQNSGIDYGNLFGTVIWTDPHYLSMVNGWIPVLRITRNPSPNAVANQKARRTAMFASIAVLLWFVSFTRLYTTPSRGHCGVIYPHVKMLPPNGPLIRDSHFE